MDVSHAILFLENADFVRITGLYFPAKFELYNREQVPNPLHHWSDENFPVTKLTGRNVRLAKLSDLKIHVINNSFLDEVDEKNSHFF